MDIFAYLAIGSAVFAAIASILARTLLSKIKSKDILGINFILMFIGMAVFSPIFFMFELSLKALLLVLLIVFIDTAGNYFYFKTYEETGASVATPLLSLAPCFTFFFGWIFINEQASWITLTLSISIISIIILFSLDYKDLKKFRKETLIPAMASSFLFGVSAIPTKYLLHTIQATNAPTLYMFRSLLIALFALIIFGRPSVKLKINQIYAISIRGLFVIGQWLLLYYALDGGAGVSLTLANITPVFVFIFAAIFLKENITPKKTFAAALIIILSLVLTGI